MKNSHAFFLNNDQLRKKNCPLFSCIYMCLGKQRIIFTKNNKDIFIKTRTKVDEELTSHEKRIFN